MAFRLILPCIAAALVSAPAFAQDNAQPDAPKPQKEKKICRSIVGTGSIMPKMTCHTKAEWDAIAARSQSDMSRTRDIERSRGTVGTQR